MKKNRETGPALISLAERVAVPHTAVLVIDMQNDFCSRDGVVARRPDTDWHRVQSVIPRLRDFLDKARESQVRVIFVYTTHEDKEFFGPLRELMVRKGRKDFACKPGTWGAEFDSNLQPGPTDAMVHKHKYSAFVNTNLDSLLKGWGVCTLILTGVATNICVESTARDGFMKDYYIVLPRDLTAAYDESLYEATLKTIDGSFGQVVSSDDLLAIWQGTKTDRPTRAGKSS